MPVYQYKLMYGEKFLAPMDSPMLNKFGSEGWRLITILNVNDVLFYHFIREVDASPESITEA